MLNIDPQPERPGTRRCTKRRLCTGVFVCTLAGDQGERRREYRLQMGMRGLSGRSAAK